MQSSPVELLGVGVEVVHGHMAKGSRDRAGLPVPKSLKCKARGAGRGYLPAFFHVWEGPLGTAVHTGRAL